MKWKTFATLSKQELYALLNLRQQVFVVEQNCPFIDADFNDQHSDHLLGYDSSNELIAYLRLVKPGTLYAGPSIGRIITSEAARGAGIGQVITRAAINYSAKKYPGQVISISAQHRLTQFYERLGFVAQGEVYLEDDIDHIKMTVPAPDLGLLNHLRWRLPVHPVLIMGLFLSIGLIGFNFIDEVDFDQLNWVAKIDDRAISKNKYESYLSSVAQSRKSGLIDSDPESILERMIDEELLIQRAIDLGMLENNAEIRSVIIQKMIASIIAEVENLKFSRDDLELFFIENKDFFAPSPKLHILKFTFLADQNDNAQLARALLIARDIEGVAQLAVSQVIRLPNTLLPAAKIREYIGPRLTQIALRLAEGEVSQLILDEGNIHLLLSVQRLVEEPRPFNEIYEEIESEFIRKKGEELFDDYLQDLRNWYDVVKANDL